MTDAVRERRPWDKRPGETVKSYAAFKIYMDLGEKRSLIQAAHDYGEKGCTVTLLRRWSAQFDWVERANAWDGHIAAIQQAEKERVVKEVAEQWARRKLEAADRKWAHARKMTEWADEAKEKAPLFEEQATEVHMIETHDKDGAKSSLAIPVAITRKPVKWNMATIITCYQAAAALETAAIHEATAGITADDGFDPLTASPDELKAYLLKRGVKALPGA